MEYLILAALIFSCGLAIVLLAWVDSAAAHTAAEFFMDIAKMLIGALLALAYAAAGIGRKPKDEDKG